MILHTEPETGGPGSSPGDADAVAGPMGKATSIPVEPCFGGLSAMVCLASVCRLECGAAASACQKYDYATLRLTRNVTCQSQLTQTALTNRWQSRVCVKS